jgi:excisionase family DNA binding protein
MKSHLGDKKLLTVADVQQALSIGRTKVFALIASGALKSIRIGSSRRISVKALEDFIDTLEKELDSVSEDVIVKESSL